MKLRLCQRGGQPQGDTQKSSPPAQPLPLLALEIVPPWFSQWFPEQTLVFLNIALYSQFFLKVSMKAGNLRGQHRAEKPEFPLVQLEKFYTASPQV